MVPSARGFRPGGLRTVSPMGGTNDVTTVVGQSGLIGTLGQRVQWTPFDLPIGGGQVLQCDLGVHGSRP